MHLLDQLACKLLVQAAADLGTAAGEALCREPDRGLVLTLVAQARDRLDDFVETYSNSGQS